MSSTTDQRWQPLMSSFSTSNSTSDFRPGASDVYPRRLESLYASRPEIQATKPMAPASVMSTSPRSPSSRGKLHKRDSSSSSLVTTPISAFPAYDMSYDTMIRPPPATHQDLHSPSSKSKVTLKPLLRKLAPQESSGSLDLSLSAAENEGLGIYTSANVGRENRVGSDASHAQISHSRRGYHRRTTSGTSQVSATTTSSNQRAGSQYVHPMRQTPQSYTPPFSHSYQNSRSSEFGSTLPTAHDSVPSLPISATLPHHPASYSYGALPTSDPTRTRSPLQIRTSSPSHHTIPGTPSSLRYADSMAHGADLAASIPGTSRSSMDSSFRLKRSRTNTATTLDPAVTQATVNVLRAEFAAREAAKDAKHQMAEARALEREKLRREKRDESARRKDEADQRKRARSAAGSEASRTVGAVEYGSVKAYPVQSGDVELEKLEREREKTRRMRTRSETAKSEKMEGGLPKKKKPVKAVMSQWSLFLFQCKTMWLKIKRSIGLGSG